MTYIMPLAKGEKPCGDCIEWRGEWCCTMNCGPVCPPVKPEPSEET